MANTQDHDSARQGKDHLKGIKSRCLRRSVGRRPASCTGNEPFSHPLTENSSVCSISVSYCFITTNDHQSVKGIPQPANHPPACTVGMRTESKRKSWRRTRTKVFLRHVAWNEQRQIPRMPPVRQSKCFFLSISIWQHHHGMMRWPFRLRKR